MNYLQQLIELRDMTVQDLANAIHLGYHCVQKTVKGHKRGVQTRAAIAGHLGLDPVKVWGRGSALYLRRLVAIEANKVAQQKAEITRKKFIAKYSDSATLPAKRKAVNV
ncbi:MAG: hypothetical protein WA003_04895 [Desulfuromonadaceae bacterium]